MAQNVEFKARIESIDRTRAAALPAGARAHAVEERTDRYYVVDGGRGEQSALPRSGPEGAFAQWGLSP